MMGTVDEEAVDTFVLGLNLGPEAGSFLWSLPEEVRAKVIRNFNPRGTKDGNVFGRLQAFAKSMLQTPPGRHTLGSGNVWLTAAENDNHMGHTVAPQDHCELGHSAHRELRQYASSIGLDEAGAHFLEALSQDVRDTIISDFDPRGTKDGNVFGRLLGFARAVWAQRLGLDAAQQQEAAVLLRGLPEEAQTRVMTQFDFSGTKDGNILARLQRFANDVASRYAPTATVRVASSLAPPIRASVSASNGPSQLSTAVSEFVVRLGLDSATLAFLQALPEEVRSVVLTSFNPNGTKDGNVWGRLFGFVRSVWAQRLGLDPGTVVFLKGLPEEMQRAVMVKFDPSRTKDGNINARLESFARSFTSQPHPGIRQPASCPPVAAPVNMGLAGAHMGSSVGNAKSPPADSSTASTSAMLRDFTQRWGLNKQAASFLETLPEAVSTAVLGSFNANGTKDGNVWGRLFGFVRSVWAQKLGLDNSAFMYVRGLPEDVQMEVMGRFQLNQTAPEHDVLRQLRALADEVLQSGNVGRQEHHPADPGTQVRTLMRADGPVDPQEDVDRFVRRCGLDNEAVGFLHGLSAEVRIAVISDFDPGGTKDGNVFGRLQGFARSVQGRRKRLLDAPQCGRNVRGRLQDACQ